MEFRVRSSGELKTQGEIRKLNPNVSLPKVWNSNVYDALGIDPVLETPKPTPSAAYKSVVRDGAEQDSKDNWVQKWAEQDMFADTEEATKSEQETAYQAQLDAAAASVARSERDAKLAETDWMGMSDVTMSADWATYRQALRDVPAQSGFPNSITWPDEP
tara:strand:- start:741 stop:1220 length:480 start_codon:yes stop_codon:yes gene_type:complete